MQTPKPLGLVFQGVVGWLWVFSTAANVLLLAAPIYMVQIYGRILPSSSTETLIYLTALIVGALAVYGLLEALRSALAQKLSARYELTATRALLKAALHRRDGFDEAIRDAGVARQFLGSRAFVCLFDLPFAPLFLGILFLAHPVLGLATFAGAAGLLGLAVLNRRALGASPAEAAEEQHRAGRYAGAALSRSEDVRAMGMAPQMLQRWFEAALGASRAADNAGVWNARFFGASRFVRQSIQIAVLGIGAALVLAGEMSAGLIFAASLLAGRALAPMEQVVGNWRQLSQGLAAHRCVQAVLAEAAAGEGSAPLQLPAPTGALALRDAGLALAATPRDVVLLDGISLEARPGEILAVLGPSGAGKSTLARLMVGIAAPTSGEVRLGGFCLDQWDPEQRGRAVGYMGQASEFLDGTVAENISRFDPGATDEQIVRAAQRAEAHAFVASLAEGYNTRLGAGGVRLSGGQLQRIALARALYGAPALLVLDEPNAHLDADGEAALLAALNGERRRGCAIVVVSQRRSILRVADRVAMLEAGRLVSLRAGDGSRTDLASEPGTAGPPRRLQAKVTNFRRSRPGSAAPAVTEGEPAHA